MYKIKMGVKMYLYNGTKVLRKYAKNEISTILILHFLEELRIIGHKLLHFS